MVLDSEWNNIKRHFSLFFDISTNEYEKNIENGITKWIIPYNTKKQGSKNFT